MKATWNRITRALRRTPAAAPAVETMLDGAQEEIAAGAPIAASRPLALQSPRTLGWLVAGTAVVAAGAMVYRNPPVQHLGQGELGVRVNQFTGSVSQWRDGSVWVLPGLHSVRVFTLRDQTYRAEQMRQATGSAPLQSVEGLSFGLDLSVRYALDPAAMAARSAQLPDNIGAEIVEPAVQGLIYKVFARYTVREIFSSKRAEIQQIIETELRTRLAADGVLLRHVQIGKVDLPAEYRRGMDSLLAEELASEKMRYTLELKDKRVKETELDASADKVRREVAAEASAREQVIAARAQEEAMKHVLPFKQRQIEQRQLEAEAEKVSRIKAAEGNAQARRIEANGEADARQKLAEAEAYRMDRIGKVNAEQMAREGALVTRHPLLIQKTLADKLSDKIQVIIAPPPTNGDFIGAALLGGNRNAQAVAAQAAAGADDASTTQATEQ
ncbi:SPFH domain-containing protein [Acidovorax sp. A1169]|uniref:SPFH domain-containing protein n=1 Tax=Acidovorax sp. A1169 TaxID=3059524 RepID=UPI002737B083|nr:SPFH domain-containing protein [Acidovorax sp. A1169]MDP4076057.1 SPFH domain-containing protein [Acidovorax sp. A1169]